MLYNNQINGNNLKSGNNENNVIDMDVYKIKKATLLIRALNHPIRKEILKVIHENPGIIVTDLYERLHLQQSILSQHLAVLRRVGVLSDKRDGKFIYYSINMPKLSKINELIEKLVDSK